MAVADMHAGLIVGFGCHHVHACAAELWRPEHFQDNVCDTQLQTPHKSRVVLI